MQANDESFMRLALKEAQKAFDKNEVPVGAVAVKDGKVIAKAHNIREKTHDLLGHAEILLLKKISKGLKDWRLQGVTLYVTLEPCLMCLGAILEGRISHLVYGAPDPSAGALRGFYHLAEDLNLSRLKLTHGILEEESLTLLRSFFRELRLKKKHGRTT